MIFLNENGSLFSIKDFSSGTVIFYFFKKEPSIIITLSALSNLKYFEF